MATLLGVSVRSIATWELTTPPRGIMLARLARIAGLYGYMDLRTVFLEGLDAEARRLREPILKEMERADAISKDLEQLHVFVSHVHDDQDVPARRRKEAEAILKSVEALKQKIAASQEWSWRNQR
jgi:hypothetical protein